MYCYVYCVLCKVYHFVCNVYLVNELSSTGYVRYIKTITYNKIIQHNENKKS